MTIGPVAHFPRDAMAFDSRSFARWTDRAEANVQSCHRAMTNVAAVPRAVAIRPGPDGYRLHAVELNAEMSSLNPKTPSADHRFDHSPLLPMISLWT
jgi:hypothetical protein